MSWLSNAFKSLKSSSDDVDDDQNDQNSPSIGVKDDFSSIGESFSRQLRGVAAFLAPPPQPEFAGGSSTSDDSSFDALAGIRSDLAEIGGSFKSSLSMLSSNGTVAGISKLASNFLQLNENEDDNEVDDDDDGVGITDDVIEFAKQISNRVELWTSFPLLLDKEFDLSDAQSEHVSVIEQLVPDLADLRSSLTDDMDDNHFWMIYFILLLPRLNDDDLELLSSPEIVEARETLMMMLRNKNETVVDSENPQSVGSSESPNKVDDTTMQKSQSVEEVVDNNTNASKSSENNESENTKKLTKEEDGNISITDDHSRSDAKADDNSSTRTLLIEETNDNSNIGTTNEGHENVDNWSEGDKEAVTTRTSHSTSKAFQSEDDVSFSDLEDDDNDIRSRQLGSGLAQSTRTSSPEGSSEWVRLNKNVGSEGSQLRDQSSSRDRDSEGDESSDWLTIDDFDP